MALLPDKKATSSSPSPSASSSILFLLLHIFAADEFTRNQLALSTEAFWRKMALTTTTNTYTEMAFKGLQQVPWYMYQWGSQPALKKHGILDSSDTTKVPRFLYSCWKAAEKAARLALAVQIPSTSLLLSILWLPGFWEQRREAGSKAPRLCSTTAFQKHFCRPPLSGLGLSKSIVEVIRQPKLLNIAFIGLHLNDIS